METKFILKYGLGHPGTVLANAEPAIDSSFGNFYIGKGIGNLPFSFYPNVSINIVNNYATNASINNTLTYYVTNASLAIICGGYY